MVVSTRLEVVRHAVDGADAIEEETRSESVLTVDKDEHTKTQVRKPKVHEHTLGT